MRHSVFMVATQNDSTSDAGSASDWTSERVGWSGIARRALAAALTSLDAAYTQRIDAASGCPSSGSGFLSSTL